MHPVGHSVQYDYRVDSASEKLAIIPSGSIDLVTINQGLHHIPPDQQLFDFLCEVRRILTPGGLFIIREHDLVDPSEADRTSKDNPYHARIEMLDLAHSVFNAVTGVSPEDEEQEMDMTVLFETRLFHSMGLLTSEQLSTIYQIILRGNEGETLATGTVEDKQMVLEGFLTSL